MMRDYLTAIAAEIRDALNQRDPQHLNHWQTTTDPHTGELTVVAVPKEDA